MHRSVAATSNARPLQPDRHASASNDVGVNRTDRLVVVHHTRKTRSFFSRAEAAINNTLRSLRPFRPALAAAVDVRRARETYDYFRKHARQTKAITLDQYEGHLTKRGLSAADIKSCHREFDRKMAESFPAILYDLRQRRPGLGLSIALPRAYQSAVNKVLASQNAYVPGYVNAMKRPMRITVDHLKFDAYERRDPSSPSPKVMRAPRPIAPDKFLVVLSAKECEVFKDERMAICRETIGRYREEFLAQSTGMLWPENVIDEFKASFETDYDNSLSGLPKDGISVGDLQVAHAEAMEMIVEVALEAGKIPKEIDAGNRKMFTRMLKTICRHIKAELDLRANPRITGLFHS